MIPEPRLKNLYQEVILDHNRVPRNFQKLEKPTHYSHGVNPLCGDDYHLYLDIDSEGIVQKIGFQGSGCAISKSSASIMTTLVKGKKIQEAKKLLESFLLFMTQPDLTPEIKESVGKMGLFEGVREFPIRVKCATLIWHALEDALRDADVSVKK